MKNQAFTLIEVLIAVLIIGILAAIAVPQYQKAVAKSKASQLRTLLSSVGKSFDMYYLANGEYPSSLDELDLNINLPITNGLTARQNVTCGKDIGALSYQLGDDFEIALYNRDNYYMLSAHFTNGKYKCRGFVYYPKGLGGWGGYDGYLELDGYTYCGEHYYGRACGTGGCERGLFCQDVMGMTYIKYRTFMNVFK